MLNLDPWSIALIITSLIASVTSTAAAIVTIKVISRWNPLAADEGQLESERLTFLVSTGVRFAFWVNVANGVLFLFAVNNHYPDVVKGAMCAQGVFDISWGGNWALMLMFVSSMVGLAFFHLDRLDQREPSLPLTPDKLYLTFALAIGYLATSFTLITFLVNIDPDIITTCCSVTFGPASQGLGSDAAFSFTSIYVGLFFGLGGGLLALSFIRPMVLLPLSLCYVLAYYLSVKFYFSKYIYGIIGHYCIYDLFLGHYRYVGFAMTLGLLAVISYSMAIFWIKLFAGRLSGDLGALATGYRMKFVLALVVSMLIPLFYWAMWGGKL